MKMNRPILFAAALVLLGGCSSYREIPRGDLVPESSFTKIRVATLDGFEYRFDRGSIAADTLIGFYRVTEERRGPGKQVWFEDALRQQGIPLARVARVELIRKDPVRSVFWGASIGAAGFFLVNLVDESSHKSTRPGSGGKPPP
jgi:hypothetical protein